MTDGKAVSRSVEVDPERLGRWVLGFAERHGGLVACSDTVADPVAERRGAPGTAALCLTAGDGAVAELRPFDPHGTPETAVADLDGNRGADQLIDGLVPWALPPDPLGLVLLRRGGFAVGVAHGSRLVAHKTGGGYVQSRTAAGGWSQQRFARRRANQAEALVVKAVDQAVRVVLPDRPAALVVGGDRRLVTDALAEQRLSPLATLPRRELFDLPDPRLAVLEKALRRGRAVRVRLTEP
ncbi:MAG TPA: acVLRF1 family peptidyl-tRNA hydrolase [Segeticoccus sp.]|uniref:acVLRF1 family peptidyl-tRNA hydrolase n=1 Tax=Segeticoccus sp. TaxID=2706531 RepID=UPI002D7E659D|nr:acVLRF1 family peptidyl-tRNA hydrolase [Segeticoccus sp.]HET8602226.1 acVLRF1 family peptidyl-tRNA hydrolase [Segeticoccus sp.]